MAEGGIVRQYKDRFKVMQTEKGPWNIHYQTIGEYVMTRKKSFTSDQSQGEFLNDELFDGTAPRAKTVMASVLLGMLWPNGSRSFRLLPPFGLEEDDDAKSFCEDATKRLISVMDNPKSGLSVALGEYMLDQVCFGTSGIAIMEKDGVVPVQYMAWDVKTMHIQEGPDGNVDTLFNFEMMTVRKVVKKYGIDVVSTATADKYKTGKDTEKIGVLTVIEPRQDRDPDGLGAMDMPYASIHFEFESEHVLRVSGFSEFPVPVARFYKAMGEEYGRSPAMEALPDIIELNTIMESVTIAIEKNLAPPLALIDDGRLGGGTIDTSPNAVNVFNPDGRISSDKVIFPLYTVGELKSVQELIVTLREAISNAFYLDRLLDLNNDVRMTLGEAQIRNRIRGDSLSSVFMRQISEMFTPLIERTFNIMYMKGDFGVIPGSERHALAIETGVSPKMIPESIARKIQSKEEAYRIQFISPASKMMQAEEITGVLATFDFANAYAAVAPDVLDNIDADRATKLYAELSGTPTDLIRSPKQIKALREAREQQLAEKAQQDAEKQRSETMRNMAQAGAANTSAQVEAASVNPMGGGMML